LVGIPHLSQGPGGQILLAPIHILELPTERRRCRNLRGIHLTARETHPAVSKLLRLRLIRNNKHARGFSGEPIVRSRRSSSPRTIPMSWSHWISGVGVGHLEKIVLRPELGVLFNPGDDGAFTALSLGATVYSW